MKRLTYRLVSGAANVHGIDASNGDSAKKSVARQRAFDRLAEYEDIGLTPEESTYLAQAAREAEKLISTMKNNKRAAIWLRKYGPAAEAEKERMEQK